MTNIKITQPIPYFRRIFPIPSRRPGCPWYDRQWEYYNLFWQEIKCLFLGHTMSIKVFKNKKDTMTGESASCKRCFHQFAYIDYRMGINESVRARRLTFANSSAPPKVV